MKESTLQRGMSVDEQDGSEEAAEMVKGMEEKGIPIRKS